MSNYGLFIVWPNYFHLASDIIEDIGKEINIIEIYDIEWSKDNFFNNIYRFYGDRLATSSVYEKAKDKYKFKLIVVEDLNPINSFRLNARGVEKVNTNFFDLKKLLRKKYNTKFGIHGSNDEIETNRDLSLLLGINLEDYKKKNKSKDTIQIKRNITGDKNWNSFEELFYFLNSVEPYVILRNQDEISQDISEEDDIDFLVLEPKKMAYFLNAKKMSKGTERVNYQIIVNNKKIRIDLRYVGDGYFDMYWQNNCMKNRVLINNMYVLDQENSYYSLIYHVLIHKRKIPKKYLNDFNCSVNKLRDELYGYMYEKEYSMVEPKDITLNFNKKYGGDIKFSKERRLRNKKGFIGTLKNLLYKLNNIIHIKRGPA